VTGLCIPEVAFAMDVDDVLVPHGRLVGRKFYVDMALFRFERAVPIVPAHTHHSGEPETCQGRLFRRRWRVAVGCSIGVARGQSGAGKPQRDLWGVAAVAKVVRE